jgi:hypothetical protein
MDRTIPPTRQALPPSRAPAVPGAPYLSARRAGSAWPGRCSAKWSMLLFIAARDANVGRELRILGWSMVETEGVSA